MYREFWLPDYVPPSLNILLAKGHWSRDKFKEEALEYVYYFVKGFKTEKLKSLSYTFYFKDKRKRDNDNYCAKYLTDALRYAGVLKEDDSASTGPTTLFVEFNNPKKITGTKIIFEVE